MLFNSLQFILLFLPAVILAFFLARSEATAQIILIAASLLFYGWWDYRFLPFIVAVVAINYWFGIAIASEKSKIRKKAIFVAGIIVNLAPLAFFKYGAFVTSNLNYLGTNIPLLSLVLPLGISFFTFQKIALLADIYEDKITNPSFRSYLLFIIFFPHLIAGPITNPREMLPQFEKRQTYHFRLENFFIGGSFFVIGLFKKVGIADQVAAYSTPIFSAVHAGADLTFMTAWGAAVAYALQIYFDFSGYSDMAIGLARIFSIDMPINFNSPYQATCAIEFWRRWHMSLSRFLRDYLYIPLGGSRTGKTRTHFNIMIVMLLGGLWHGAGWNFVLWGGLHGLFLVINHLWRSVALLARLSRTWWTWPLTMLAVIVAWVPFRALEFHSVQVFYTSMFDIFGASASLHRTITHEATKQIVLLGIVGGVAAFLPNSIQLFANYVPFCKNYETTGISTFIQPSVINGMIMGCLIAICLIIILDSGPREFLYFQF